MGYPVYDPHGEVIPDASGRLLCAERMEVYELVIHGTASDIGVFLIKTAAGNSF